VNPTIRQYGRLVCLGVCREGERGMRKWGSGRELVVFVKVYITFLI
jgi:hypothetical protein